MARSSSRTTAPRPISTLGHYERFTGVDAKQSDNITTGRIYSSVIGL